MKAEREDWFEAQDELDPDRLVFLDETVTTTNMVRRYGWAVRGERCRVAVPHGHWKTTTVTAALRTSGVAATVLFDGATNGQRFRAYVTDTLVPVLKRGDTVIMDNLAAHKVAGVREAIQAAGAKLLYLPPYSPDLNPITDLRQAQSRPAQSRRADASRSESGNPIRPRQPYTKGLPQLPDSGRIRRIRSNLIGNSSSLPRLIGSGSR
ncbi:transposase [Methylorubrum extorquens DSM 13060]|uniref:Transposase n=1 Tax=Methylorubrum extorquens DSM 13060 TaxID=882800 RepID=H1KI29_METEX|nr:transposase [Methylorubrum extorquens DSM 13060]